MQIWFFFFTYLEKEIKLLEPFKKTESMDISSTTSLVGTGGETNIFVAECANVTTQQVITGTEPEEVRLVKLVISMSNACSRSNKNSVGSLCYNPGILFSSASSKIIN